MDRTCTSRLPATMIIRISSTHLAVTMENNCTVVVPDKDLWEAALEGHLAVVQDPLRPHTSHTRRRMSVLVSVLHEVACSSSSSRHSSRVRARARQDRVVLRVKDFTVVLGLVRALAVALVGLNRAPIISKADLKGICTPSKARTMRASTIRARVDTGSKGLV